MHDIKSIRDNPHAFSDAMARRGTAVDLVELLAADDRCRELSHMQQELEREKNEIARVMSTPDRTPALRKRGSDIKDELVDIHLASDLAKIQLHSILSNLPNIPAEDVPDGKDETSNVVEMNWGIPRKMAFTPLDHAELASDLGIDFKTAATVSGARFVYMTGISARLHRALGQFMLDMNTQRYGFAEVNPPLLVKPLSMVGTGQLPKFEEDLYRIGDKGDASDRYLIPTAEVSLTNMFREKIIDVTTPIRLTALTPCFRSEAGSAGRDTRGMIRQHQFEKVELVTLCAPEDAEAEHLHMLTAAEAILQALELPFRRVLLCSGDMGFSARKTYDLEVWLPGQNTYREISSISHCGDFQARRMQTRYRTEKGTQFVHTLNGSALAVGRTLVAVIEYYQLPDGTIRIPDVLLPYMSHRLNNLDKNEP